MFLLKLLKRYIYRTSPQLKKRLLEVEKKKTNTAKKSCRCSQKFNMNLGDMEQKETETKYRPTFTLFNKKFSI